MFETLNLVDVPIFVLEPDAAAQPVYVWINRAGVDWSSFRVSDVAGKTALDIYGGRRGRVAYDHHLAALRTGQSLTYSISLPMDGEVRRLRTRLEPVLTPTGRVERIIGTSLDVTSEAAIADQAVMQETVLQEMQNFVALMAHDLRSPMANVKMLADLLRHNFEDLGDGKLKKIDMLEEVAVKAMALVTDVMDYSAATQAKPMAKTFDLCQMCDDLMVMLDPEGFHFAVSDDVRIVGDQTAMQIVLRNLMSNAFKHAGRASVDLDIRVDDPGLGMVYITLSDNGSGFDRPQAKFLAGADFTGGTGYGLLGVRRLIQARGGAMRLQNRPEGGAQVQFSLPGSTQDTGLPALCA